MNKFFLLVGIFMSASIFSLAQSSDDYAKNEYYVGFSHQQVQNIDLRKPYQGFEGSYVRNFHRYFGAKADFSAAFYRNSRTSGNVKIEDKRSLYNVLGGIQIKNNTSESRLKPFGHVLAGVGFTRNRFICPTCLIPDLNQNDAGFAAAVGGGLDIKLNDKINIRAFQVDYNPVRVKGVTNDNVRIGVGISFK